MSKTEIYIITPLMFIFVLHGILYYAFPQAHYQSEGAGLNWIVSIKYICVVISLPLLIAFRFNTKKLLWFGIGSIPIQLSIVPSTFWLQSANPLLLQFQIPMLGFFFAPFLSRLCEKPIFIKRALFCVLAASFAASVYDVYSGGIILNFSRSGLRASGPFINPNNTGIVVALVGVSLHYLNKSTASHLLTAVLSIGTIALVGSKTAGLIYLLGIAFVMPQKIKLYLSAMSIILMSLFSDTVLEFFASLGLRSLSLESGAIRTASFTNFIDGVGREGILPLLFGETRVSTVDNAYLDILGFGGLFSLTFFLAFQIGTLFILARIRETILLVVFVLLAIAMTSTNIPRLWPTAYAYWAIVGFAFLRATTSRGLNSPNRQFTKIEAR